MDMEGACAAGKECHVLLADDDETTLLVVQQLLKRSGYKVTTARDGQEALETLQTCGGVDLILTDNVMPQVSGIKLASEVGKAPKWRHLPVVVMSSDASESAVREATAAGVADFLVKPIRRNEVVTLGQHVWRSMQALAAAGRRLAGGTGTTVMARQRPASRSDAEQSQDLPSQGCASAASEQTAWLPASKRARTQHPAPWQSLSQAGCSSMQAAQLGSSGSIEVDGSYSGLSEGLHMPGRLADWSQEAPDLGQSTAGPRTSVLPRILSAPCILARERPSNIGTQSSALEASSETEQASAAAPGDAGRSASSELSLHGSVRWSSPELVTIDLKIAPLNLESFTGNAAAPSMSASGTQAAGLQEVLLGREAESAAAASLCALARGVCAMLPAACTQFQAQVAQTVSKKRAECAAQTACSGAACTLQVEHQPKQQQQAPAGDPATWAANRKAALEKLREKKKLRNYDKKVRYESRRRLAESRPRVRGQFVKALVKAG